MFCFTLHILYCNRVVAGVINRGDSFRRKRSRSNSLATSPMSPSHSPSHPMPSRSSTGPVDSYRVSMLGGPGVGKTALISQFRTSECINAYEDTGECGSTSSLSLLTGSRVARTQTMILIRNKIRIFIFSFRRKSST